MVRLPILVTTSILVWLVVLPLIYVVAASLGLVDDSFLRAVGKILGDRAMPTVLWNTFQVAVAVSACCLVLGTALALALERTRLRAPGLVDKLLLVPIMVSPLVGTVAWVTLGRPSTGFINTLWRTATGAEGALFNVYSFTGIVLVMTLHFAPYVYLAVRGALANVDGAMEEAAVILGAYEFRTWTRVTLPLAIPAMLSSTLLVFVLAMETFSIAGLLGGPARFITLPYNIYLTINLPPGDWNYAALQGLLLVLMTATLMAGYWAITRGRGKYSAIGGKGARSAATAHGAWGVGFGTVTWIYIAVAVVIPILALVLQSFLAFATNHWLDMAFTTTNWTRLFNAAVFQVALRNTLLIGFAAATLAVIIALMVSHLTVFERARHLDGLATMPLAIPGIVLGIALVFIYSGTPLYGSFAVMVIGFATQFLPFAVRTLSGPMLQIDRGLDEAGKMLGAHTARRMMRLTAPILRGPLLAAWVVTFTRSFRELNVPIFLATPATGVIAMVLWTYMENSQTGLAAALSLFQIGLLVLIVSVAERFTRKLSLA